MRERPGPSFSAEVITSTVWDAIKGIPGVADLYRNPLQTLGERVHMERHGPVRLGEDDAGPWRSMWTRSPRVCRGLR